MSLGFPRRFRIQVMSHALRWCFGMKGGVICLGRRGNGRLWSHWWRGCPTRESHGNCCGHLILIRSLFCCLDESDLYILKNISDKANLDCSSNPMVVMTCFSSRSAIEAWGLHCGITFWEARGLATEAQVSCECGWAEPLGDTELLLRQGWVRGQCSHRGLCNLAPQVEGWSPVTIEVIYDMLVNGRNGWRPTEWLWCGGGPIFPVHRGVIWQDIQFLIRPKNFASRFRSIVNSFFWVVIRT